MKTFLLSVIFLLQYAIHLVALIYNVTMVGKICCSDMVMGGAQILNTI